MRFLVSEVPLYSTKRLTGCSFKNALINALPATKNYSNTLLIQGYPAHTGPPLSLSRSVSHSTFSLSRAPGRRRRRSIPGVQGYLAHKKHPPPRTLHVQWDYYLESYGGPRGRALSHEQVPLYPLSRDGVKFEPQEILGRSSGPAERRMGTSLTRKRTPLRTLP